MEQINVEDIHSMISNKTLIKSLGKEELCTCLKNTKLNLSETTSVLQQIKSKYEVADIFDIVRHLSIDFKEIENIEISNILEFLSIFGKCLEFDAFDSIVKIIESAFSKFKPQQMINKNIEALKAVQLLYARGKIDFKNVYGIFNEIVDDNDFDAMSFAIKEKLHKIKRYGRDIFYYSCHKSNFKIIRAIMESDTVNKYEIPEHLTSHSKYFLKIPGFTVDNLLREASDNGDHDAVKLLLTVPGIDVNAKDRYNHTALTFASIKGHHEVVKLLLTVPGIDVNAKDRDNKTALLHASYYSHNKIVKHLVAIPGIDVNAKDCFENTPLILASANGHYETVKLLLTVPGIDVNAKNKNKNTALMMASRGGQYSIVELLLTVPGLNVNAIDNNNRTALNYASNFGYYMIANILRAFPGSDAPVN